MDPKPNKKNANKVLFVDDEINILKAVKRELFRSEFEIFLAQSVEDALKILDKEAIDLVITDVVLPRIDGLKFLDMVRKKHPKVSRMILSGYVEQSHVVKAIIKGYATIYFAKPWEAGELKSCIAHIMDVRASLMRNELLQIMNQIDTLPSLPAIYQKFIDAMSQEKSANEIAVIINSDVALSMRLLQVANSAFFGSVAVSSVEQALMRLGLSAIKDMVLAFSLINNFNWNQRQLAHLQNIVKHSALVNQGLRTVYKKKFNANLKQEYSSVGITHDIGKIILLQFWPDRYESIIENQMKNPGMGFYESETALGYGATTHCEIGAYFLDLWNLSCIMVEVALNHHRPEKAGQQFKKILDTIVYTDRLIEYVELAGNAEERDLTPFETDFISANEVLEIASSVHAG
ncbi:MAG: HDOD domain-containing protein [Planctomycetota bacterium]